MKLRVANLSPEIDNDDLEDIFSEIGEVESARVILDGNTGKSRGYGLVIMANLTDSIEQLNGTVHKGMAIKITEDLWPK